MRVTVIIPAYNAESTLGLQLDALASQVSSSVPFDVIVADNGSTDRTVAIAEEFGARLPLRVVDASARRGPSAARNQGAAHARTDVLLFCDADDLVVDGWVRAMSACTSSGTVAVGAVRYERGVEVPPSDSQQARLTMLPRYLGQVPQVLSGNLGVTREDFARVGGFDEELRCGEDADLGIRLLRAGCQILPCPDGRVVVRDRPSMRRQFVQFAEYGRWDVAVYRKHRGQGLQRPPIREALRDYASLVVHLPRLLDPQRRRSWVVTAGQRCGRLVGSFRERTFLP